MKTLVVENVIEALNECMKLFTGSSKNLRKVSPRGMKTIEYITPVSTVYLYPRERVLFSPARDANPFFHLMESFWMLAGRDDVEFLNEFSKQIAQFSDDGMTIRGAYGKRWREAPDESGFSSWDQLKNVVEVLRADPDSRRAVLAMWFPGVDYSTRKTKDLPCNTHAYFKIRESKIGEKELQMTVSCRSNDALLGAYGANAVHFSILQEYMAAHLGVGVGPYTHISDSLHIYTDSPVWKKLEFSRFMPSQNLYGRADQWGYTIEPFPLVVDPKQFDKDLALFFSHPPSWYFEDINRVEMGFEEPFFIRVVIPMLCIWFSRKNKETKGDYYIHAQKIAASDWRTACLEWCERRDPKLSKEENLGYR